MDSDAGRDRTSAEGAPSLKRARTRSGEEKLPPGALRGHNDTLKNFRKDHPHLHKQLSLAYSVMQCGYAEATLHDLGDIDAEGELTVFLMNHLIAPLSVNKTWVIDKRYKNKDNCKCPCVLRNCPKPDPTFTDTSIGNVQVWHGSVDGLTSDELVAVDLEGFDQRTDVESADEVKLDKKCAGKGQLFGQSIVFSFLQKKLHPELSFVPVLGLKRDSVKICMYETTNDVFVVSKTLSYDKEKTEIERMVVFLMVWLSCNYRLFFTPCSVVNRYLSQIPQAKAGFPDFAEDTIDIYKKRLRYTKLYQQGTEKEDAECTEIKTKDVLQVDVEGLVEAEKDACT